MANFLDKIKSFFEFKKIENEQVIEGKFEFFLDLIRENLFFPNKNKIPNEIIMGERLKPYKLTKEDKTFLKQFHSELSYFGILHKNDLLSDFRDFRLLPINEENFQKLVVGETITSDINSEKFHIKIDFNAEKISIIKEIKMDDLFTIQDLTFSNPELFKLLNSYERLPLGEFSYNHLDQIIKEAQEIGYKVEFDEVDGASLSSIQKIISIEEFKEVIENHYGFKNEDDFIEDLIDNELSYDNYEKEEHLYKENRESELTIEAYEFDLSSNHYEFKHVDMPLEVNDKLLVNIEGKNEIGRINSIENNKINITAGENKYWSVDITKNQIVEPLFINDYSNQTKTEIKFGVQELIAKTKELNIGLQDRYTLLHDKQPELIKLLKGEQTGLLQFHLDPKQENSFTSAKLHLTRQPDSSIQLTIEQKQKQIEFKNPITQQQFSKTEIEKILKTGELGFVKTNNNYHWISLDRELNKIVATPGDKININKLIGVELSPQEKQKLAKGEGIEKNINNQSLYVIISPISKHGDNFRIYSSEKAKEMGLIITEKEKKEKSHSIKR